MLPASHAAADVHGLGGPGAPHCAGRALSLSLGVRKRAATASHLEIAVSEDAEHVYDMVRWPRPAGSTPRFEVELGQGNGGHHRLADHFSPTGAARHRLLGGATLHLRRSVSEEATVV